MDHILALIAGGVAVGIEEERDEVAGLEVAGEHQIQLLVRAINVRVQPVELGTDGDRNIRRTVAASADDGRGLRAASDEPAAAAGVEFGEVGVDAEGTTAAAEIHVIVRAETGVKGQPGHGVQAVRGGVGRRENMLPAGRAGVDEEIEPVEVALKVSRHQQKQVSLRAIADVRGANAAEDPVNLRAVGISDLREIGITEAGLRVLHAEHRAVETRVHGAIQHRRSHGRRRERDRDELLSGTLRLVAKIHTRGAASSQGRSPASRRAFAASPHRRA